MLAVSTLRRALVLMGDRDDDLALVACGQLRAHGLEVAVGGVAGAGTLLRLSASVRRLARVAESREAMEEAGPAVLEAASALARDWRAELVFGADIPGALLADALRPRLPGVAFYPSPGAATLRRLDDKWSFHGLLREHGLPTPRTWRVESLEQALALPRPLILKPERLGGGRGVHRVDDEAALRRLLGGGDPDLRLPVLAQEFVDGEDVDLSFLAVDGRLDCWAVQVRHGDRTLEYLADERVVELGRRLAAAARYTGLAHVDMRYVDRARSGVSIIECNPRLWMSSPQTLGLGIDFVGRGLALAAGAAPAPFREGATGRCADLGPVLSRRLRGKPVTACEKAFLSHALSDPLPVLFRRLCTAAGRRPADLDLWTI